MASPPSEPHPWLRQSHDIPTTNVQELGADDPRADTPPGFVGGLWPPQATILAQMLAVEDSQMISVTLYKARRVIQFSAARIAAEFSFGKTVLCIALICAPQSPKAFPLASPLCKNLTVRYRHEVKATLVLAANSVLRQWEDCVRQFAPGLRVFTVDNVHSLKKFSKTFSELAGNIPYDLVLLKAGSITTNYRLNTEKNWPRGVCRPILDALKEVTAGYAWSRMIIDDYDTINLNVHQTLAPANFTWFISATRKKVRGFCDTGPCRVLSTQLVYSAAKCDQFNSLLTFKCSEEYMEEFINTTGVGFRRLVVEGYKAASLLDWLGVDPEIIEMAVSGAVQTAASSLGISVDSVGDIFTRLLAKEKTAYCEAVRLLGSVGEARRISFAAAGPPNTEQEAEEISDLLRQTAKDPCAAPNPAYGLVRRHGAPLEARLKATETFAKNTKTRSGLKLERLRDNVREGMCQVCNVPFGDGEEGHAYVTSCCQITLCNYCTLVSETRGHKYITQCPNCQAAIRPDKDLIFVGADVGLDNVLEEVSIPDAPTEQQPPPAADKPEDLYSFCEQDSRKRALLQLVKGDELSVMEDLEIPPLVTNLLAGKRQSPHPVGKKHRYLVFAMHSESSRGIRDGLARVGVASRLLQGSRKQKENVIQEFKAGRVDVLIATSSRDCAGLHLPEVTRLVLYHRHRDKAILQQCIGRAQRVGREHNLEVVEIVDQYDN